VFVYILRINIINLRSYAVDYIFDLTHHTLNYDGTTQKFKYRENYAVLFI